MADRGLPTGWAHPDLDESGHASYRFLRILRRALVERFRASVRDPARAQEEALGRVLDAARGTEFARRHGLDRVRTLREYRDAVPIRAFSGFADDLRRVAAGETTVLVRHPVLSLVKTSGTTGSAKLLPVTEPWAREVAEAQFLWVLAMVREQVELTRGMVLTSVGKAVEGHSPGGIPFGANTGRMAAAQPWLVRSRYALPPRVHAIEDPDVRHYVALRIALALDVRSWTTANPSTVLALCRAMQRHREDLTADLADGTLVRGPAASLDRADRRALWAWSWRKRAPADFRPAAFWKLAAINCWKGGAAPFFLDRLPEAVGAELPIREAGISASEGYFGIPLHSSWWGGVAWAGGHLLELVDDAGVAHGLEEAEVGREYNLVISTTAGLYRYDLDDVVRVEGHYFRAPVLRFLRKGRDVLSVTGEKVTAEQAAEAVRQALDGQPVVGFTVTVRMEEKPVYVMAIEGAEPRGVAERFDRALRSLNVEYDSKRATDRLAPPEAHRVPDGTYAAWRARRMAEGAAEGQVKEPILIQPTADAGAGWATKSTK